MAATTGTPPGGTTGTTGTSDSKPRATKVIDSGRDKPDAASAATTESTRPSAEKILESNTSSTGSTGTGTSTPSSITVTETDTGKSSTATYPGSGSTGIGGVTEPSGTVASTINTSSGTDNGPKADADTLTAAARDIGQQVGSRAGEEWQQRKRQVSEVAGNLRATASRTAEQVRRQSRQGVDAAQTVVTEHPLATGMVALGVGLLVAGLLYSQSRRQSRPYYRDREVDFGEYPSNRTYDYRDEERDYRRAEGNAGYDRSGY